MYHFLNLEKWGKLDEMPSDGLFHFYSEQSNSLEMLAQCDNYWSEKTEMCLATVSVVVYLLHFYGYAIMPNV